MVPSPSAAGACPRRTGPAAEAADIRAGVRTLGAARKAAWADRTDQEAAHTEDGAARKDPAAAAHKDRTARTGGHDRREAGHRGRS
ncbi:hypothetical protein GCM10009527_020130 [Actinomadura nitritigenes]